MYRGELPKKEGLGQFPDLRGGGGLAKKKWVVFLRGGSGNLMHTMDSNIQGSAYVFEVLS